MCLYSKVTFLVQIPLFESIRFRLFVNEESKLIISATVKQFNLGSEPRLVLRHLLINFHLGERVNNRSRHQN